MCKGYIIKVSIDVKRLVKSFFTKYRFQNFLHLISFSIKKKFYCLNYVVG